MHHEHPFYLRNVQTGSVNHGVTNGAQGLKLAGLLQELLKQGGIVLGAVHSHPHGLLPRLVHSVQALSPALDLILLHQGPGEHLSA